MYELILFDLDGTLTDPKEGITKCIQYGLAKIGIDEPDLDKLVSFIGPPLKKSFREVYGLSEADATLALQYYRERFVDVGMYENAVYPGVPEMLKNLQSMGKRMVVATSKPTVYSVTILEHFQLSPFFRHIIGSNLDGTRVEKDEVIAFALEQVGAFDAAKTIMVGDRKHDVLGAAKNGINAIAVTYGYGSREELAGANPVEMVNTVSELAALLRR
ncbi:MAG: HAD family hydrolase [Negativicutes bacterium]|nr:HAD family hydrolase [Negativicutes bacterium]